MIDPSRRDELWKRIARLVEQEALESRAEIRGLVARTSLATPDRLDRLDRPWIPSGVPGVRIKILDDDVENDLRMTLIEMDPGRTFPAHRHHGPEETWVLAGDLATDEVVLRAGDHARLEPESEHGDQWTVEGCLVLISGSRRDCAA